MHDNYGMTVLYNIDKEDDKKTAKIHPVSAHVISCHL